MKKLAIIDSLYRKKINTFYFLTELLSPFYEVDYYWDQTSSYNNFTPDKSALSNTQYDLVILIQPYEKIMQYTEISCTEIIAIVNSYVSPAINNKYFSKRMKYLSLSKSQHEMFSSFGLTSAWFQYYPNPYDFIPIRSYSPLKGFYRCKSPEISPKLLTQVIDENKFESINVHDVAEPGAPSLVSHENIFKNTFISRSNWFEKKEDYINFLTNFNVYFAPHLYDISPNSVLEAMSLGMCVVSPDLPSVNEYIVHGENGLLYDPENPHPIDFTDTSFLGQNARKSIEKGYDQWLNQREKLFEYLTGSKFNSWDWSEVLNPKKFITPNFEKYKNDNYKKKHIKNNEGGKRLLRNETKNPLLTIVTVVKNSQKSLERTINSALIQTFDDFEYIVIDGMSSDYTIDIIRKYNIFIDYWISEKDNGPYHAMSKAINYARGKYIIFLNAGDWFASSSVLEELFKKVEGKPDVIYGDHIWLDKGVPYFHKSLPFSAIQGLLRQGKNNTEHWYHGLPNHQSTIVKKELLEKYKFDLQYQFAADYDFLFKIANKNKTFMQVNRLISIYQSGGMSSKNEKLCHKEWKKIFNVYGKASANMNILDSDVYPISHSIYPAYNPSKEFFIANFHEPYSSKRDKYQYSLAATNECSRVYITTPCLNAVDTIDQTIHSVISQNGDNFVIRYHIQDGGSTDGTLDYLEKWKAELSPGSGKYFPDKYKNVIFTYSSQSDDGMYDAIGRGFDLMKPPPAAIMSWINADDILFQGSLATMLKIFRRFPQVQWITGHNCLISYMDEIIGYNDEPKPTEFIKSGICEGQNWRFVQQEGTFFRKYLWDVVGGFDSNLKYAADYDLWRRFSKHAELFHFPAPIAAFRMRSGQISSTEIEKYNAEIEQVVSSTDRLKVVKDLMLKKSDCINIPSVCFRNNKYNLEKKPLNKHRIPHMGLKIFASTNEQFYNKPNNPEINFDNINVCNSTSSTEKRGDHEIKNTKNSLLLRKNTISFKNHLGTKKVDFAEGFYCQVSDYSRGFIRCNGKGLIHCKSIRDGVAKLSFTAESQTPRYSFHLRLNGRLIDTTHVNNRIASIQSKKLKLKSGTNVLEVLSPELLTNDIEIIIKDFDYSPPVFGYKNFLFSKAIRLIIGYFFEKYYLQQFPNTEELEIISPVKHYLLYGGWEGKDPNPLFSSNYYLLTYKDVYLSGINPLLHYVLHGWKEGRDPHPDFSTNRYLESNNDVKESNINPLLHYLLHGILERRRIYSCSDE